MLSRRHFLAAAAFLAGARGLPAFAAAASDDVVEIGGKISGVNPRELTLAEIRALPKAATTTHTPWHSGAVKFEGASGEELMKYIGASGQTLKIWALDDYSIKVPVVDFAKYGSIVAYRIDDKDLTIETKGPLFLIYPFDEKPEIANETFYSRCIWQIARIEVE
jgi:hypothetical protein